MIYLVIHMDRLSTIVITLHKSGTESEDNGDKSVICSGVILFMSLSREPV